MQCTNILMPCKLDKIKPDGLNAICYAKSLDGLFYSSVLENRLSTTGKAMGNIHFGFFLYRHTGPHSFSNVCTEPSLSGY